MAARGVHLREIPILTESDLVQYWQGNGRWRDLVRRDPCPYCTVFSHMTVPRGRSHMTIEHVVPRSAAHKPCGWENLVGAHSYCNQSRGNLPLLTFLWLQSNLAVIQAPEQAQQRRALKLRSRGLPYRPRRRR